MIEAPSFASSTPTAVLGGGCFWCLEAVFDRLRGVLAVESGYAGGAAANPSYEDVCSGRTGHAEVVRVTFDPAALSFRDLLKVFFAIHDPTTKDRQGGDVGTQYRSVIFCQNAEQRADAESVRNLTPPREEAAARERAADKPEDGPDSDRRADRAEQERHGERRCVDDRHAYAHRLAHAARGRHAVQ